MSRIFTVLAIVSVTLLFATMAFGLRIGEYNEQYQLLRRTQVELQQAHRAGDASSQAALQRQADETYAALVLPRQRARFHMVLAILTSIVTLLVNSLAVTYFIGTSRWCKEVVDTYQLDLALAQQSTRLKRRCFAWALTGMLLVLTIVAMGAAADPGTLRATTADWVLPHFAVALGGGGLIALSFFIQAGYIDRNTHIVEQIVARVREVRVARGLEVEA